jgi:hypothetical protein
MERYLHGIVSKFEIVDRLGHVFGTKDVPPFKTVAFKYQRAEITRLGSKRQLSSSAKRNSRNLGWLILLVISRYSMAASGTRRKVD